MVNIVKLSFRGLFNIKGQLCSEGCQLLSLDIEMAPFYHQQLAMRLYSVILLYFFILRIGSGQTCCSGGVPLSSNLGLPVSETKTLQLALTYDLNVLETLKTGRQTLEDDARSRKTHSGILEVGYSFSDKFSMDGFFSLVRQERTINQFGNTNFVATNGIGDAVLLFKYKVWSTLGNNTALQIGVGPKIPLGATNKTNPQGLALNADLQPGSGAWDGIIVAQFNHTLNFRPSMSLLATATYGLKGKNREYFDVQTYQFGNEFQFNVGLSDRLLVGKSIIDPSILFQYRSQQADKIDGIDLPSTGGSWVFVNPNVAYWLTPDLSLNVGVSLPILADIVGTQVTPTYRVTTGIFYRIPNKPKKLINFND
ncbi:MAG: transporter [Bacteroidota bacterium]